MLVMVMGMAAGALGATWTDPKTGIAWTYEISGGEAAVGSWSGSTCAIATTTTGAISIPSVLGGCPVTSIGPFAFSLCDGLTGVTVPSGVTSIGNYAFRRCRGLKSVTVPSSVRNLGTGAFTGCSGLTSVTIEQGLKSIGERAFNDCSALTEVTISEGVTNIGNYAFSDCASLSTIRWPSTVRSVGLNAFYGCVGVRALYLADLAAYCNAQYDYKYGDDDASPDYLNSTPLSCVNASSCVTLYLNGKPVTLLDIPDGVTTLPHFAFNGTSVCSVNIPPSLKSCGDGAFAGCGNLDQVAVEDLTAWFDLRGSSPLKLGGRLIVGTEIVSCLDIPPGIEEIGVFKLNAVNLKRVTIPASVRSIDWCAFSGSSLTNIFFTGDAPSVLDEETGRKMESFESAGRPSATVSVGYSSQGWNVPIPGTWKGFAIVRRPPETYCIDLVLDPDDVTSCQYYSIGEGSWVGDIPEPTRTGYSFVGWYTAAEGGFPYASNAVVSNGMTLYAHWQLDTTIPELGEDATPQEVAAALSGSADTRLAECITNVANYNAYRDWAAKVKTADGSRKAGTQMVKGSDHAWISFAVGSDKLISELPTSKDVKVYAFTPSAELDKFDLTVTVEGLTVGETALKDNLSQVFVLEGSTTLDPDGFSSDDVEVDFGTPKDGKVRFTVGPKPGTATPGAFFMRVKVKP